MAFRVRLTAPAEADAYAAFERLRAEAPDRDEAWLVNLFEAILSLAQMPRRCPRIPEARRLGRDARHLLYGIGPRSHIARGTAISSGLRPSWSPRSPAPK